jgi:putative glutamine amidotransferase
LDAALPVLAICRGMQVLNIALGGSLDGDIAGSRGDHPALPVERDTALAYRHQVEITDGSLLHRVYGTTTRQVNSLHHQAIAEPAPGVRVTARAADGTIEAIEPDGAPWCAAMQWHPELMAGDSAEKALFAAFAERCAS